MSNVTIVANKVTLKVIVDREFLGTIFFLTIIHTERSSLLDYEEGVAKADIGLKNVGQREIFKVILCC